MSQDASHKTRSVFDTLEIRGVSVPNRIALAPINTGFANRGRPSGKLLDFHKARSGRGIGISVVGNVAVRTDLVTNENTVVLDNNSNDLRHKVVTKGIKTNGSVPGIQLAACPTWLSPKQQWKPKDKEAELTRIQRHLLDTRSKDIQSVLDSFIRSIAIAEKCGYEYIEIHGAHGYLISMLSSKTFNMRSDDFSPNGPWLKNFILDARTECKGILAVRLSWKFGILEPEYEEFHSIDLARKCISHGADIISWSSGAYTLSRDYIYPKSQGIPVGDHEVYRKVKQEDFISIVSGGLSLVKSQDIAENVLLGLGRPLLADPSHSQKVLENRINDICECQRTGRCHFFTRGLARIECGSNPSIGNEV